MPVKKFRLEWLDAMRGFTMIMVVAYHVALQGFNIQFKGSSSLPFLVLFRMPLFFFVSGFLAYRASQVWNLRELGRLLLKKLRVQVVPTVVFFLFATAVLCRQSHFSDEMMTRLASPTKGGYWFTIVLLYMFIVYYVFSYVVSKLRVPAWLAFSLLFIVSLCCYETCYLPRQFAWAQGHWTNRNEFMDTSSVVQLFYYFPFFLYGNLVHRYWAGAQRVMDSRWFYPLVVVLAIFCTMDVLKWHTLRLEWTNLPLTMAKFCLLTMVFMYFRHYEKYFTKMTWVGRSLQYIGRRTLDIYLIHFLFMPNLPDVGAYFKMNQHNFVMDTTLSVLIGLLIIGFSIITSNILRVSPFFKKYLFGRS